MTNVVVIGAGLAGVEASWALANRGIEVVLYEARPKWRSPAHETENFGELVCSNSLKSEQEGHATALLKEEMRSLGSLVLMAADETRVPAGKALAVDREKFSEFITKKISSHPNIEVIREEIRDLNDSRFTIHDSRVIATGPLTSPSLTESLMSLLTYERTNAPTHQLYFYDAIAPIVEFESIDMNLAFKASRYDVGKNEEGDYINCPLTEEEYYRFIEALLSSEKIKPRDFDKVKCFEGCMPIEVMAGQHPDALRHGPMKPMGLNNPKGPRPYAVIQLRQDNSHATLFNMVGCQTRMTYSEQDRVLRTIPALKEAKFVRYGSMHRNTYINSPELLDDSLQLKSHPGLYVVGQLSGVEGYLESAATGLYLGQIINRDGATASPTTSAIGALVNHVTTANPKGFQPMNIIWGLLPPLEDFPSSRRGPKKEVRRKLLLERARKDFRDWLKTLSIDSQKDQIN